MVYDIVQSLTHLATIEVLLVNYRYKEFVKDGVLFRSSSFGLFLKSIFHCCNPLIIYRVWKRYHMRFRSLVRLIYKWLLSGYYYDLIRKGNYSVVHVHGCGFSCELWIDICRRLKQPFLITLHGLNSFSDSIELEPAGKRYERDFLRKVSESLFPITVISTGIKRKIEKTFHVSDLNNVSVVCNSYHLVETTKKISIREKYSIPLNSYLILYVGNISENKNQRQIIDSFGLMPQEYCKNTYIMFCGRQLHSSYSLADLVSKSPYREHFIVCGNVDKELMPNYYREASAVALLSKAEGFGISLIEGMHYGLPCLTFADIDAYDDFYDEQSVIGLPNRDDKTVAIGLVELLSKKWNNEYIREYAKRFDSLAMANNYYSVYNKLIKVDV